MKKVISTLLIVFIALAALPVVSAAQTSTSFEPSNETGGPFEYPKFVPGQQASVKIGFKYTDVDPPPASVKIDVVTSTDLEVFPFDPNYSNYEQTVSQNGNGIYVYSFNMRVRGDAPTKFYSIPFKITNGAKEEIVAVNMLINSDDSNSGVTPPTNTPKVIISSFSTSPSEVVAGEEFTLNVTFKNTSGSTSATNIKAQLSSDGTFTPVSGSTTIFIDSLGPNAVAAKSIRLKAKADVAPGSYNATFALNFDVAGIEDPITDTEVLAIPVVQVPRIQVSAMQIYPTEVYLGREVNVMTSVNNTGKSTLYNVNVSFTDPNGVLGDAEQFIGNILAGATGAVDVYIPTLMPGEANLTMTVTYEDENGSVFTYDDFEMVYVMEQGEPVDPLPFPDPEPTNGLGAGWIILIILLVLAVALAAFLLIRKRKKEAASLDDDRRLVAELEQEYMSDSVNLDENAENEGDEPGSDGNDAGDAQTKPEAGNEDATTEIDIPDDTDNTKKK